MQRRAHQGETNNFTTKSQNQLHFHHTCKHVSHFAPNCVSMVCLLFCNHYHPILQVEIHSKSGQAGVDAQTVFRHAVYRWGPQSQRKTEIREDYGTHYPATDHAHCLAQVVMQVDRQRRGLGSLLLETTQGPFSSSGGYTITTTNSMAAAATVNSYCSLPGIRPKSPTAAGAARPGSPLFQKSGAGVGTAAADAAAAASALARACSNRLYTELIECCCLAVLQLAVAAGQGSEPGAVCGLGDPGMAVALDDVGVAWGAVAHDEGLQLVRWSPWKYILIQQVEEGK